MLSVSAVLAQTSHFCISGTCRIVIDEDIQILTLFSKSPFSVSVWTNITRVWGLEMLVYTEMTGSKRVGCSEFVRSIWQRPWASRAWCASPVEAVVNRIFSVLSLHVLARLLHMHSMVNHATCSEGPLRDCSLLIVLQTFAGARPSVVGRCFSGVEGAQHKLQLCINQRCQSNTLVHLRICTLLCISPHNDQGTLPCYQVGEHAWGRDDHSCVGISLSKKVWIFLH